jgi:SAM-dependent methyltransferase
MPSAPFLSRLARRARKLLANPHTRGMDLDDPRTTVLRREIIAEKPFLQRVYKEWYSTLAAVVPKGEDWALELGSGAGFLDQFIPKLIRSDIFACPGVDLVLDGQSLPFADGVLRGIMMTNVLHHLPRAHDFFDEAARCVRSGGVIAMIEPWLTAWSTLIYRRLHHEPFNPVRTSWDFPPSGPLSGANGALPWIIFQRDRRKFEQDFPAWEIVTVRTMMPLRYILSGGVSLRSLSPGWSFGPWKIFEKMISPLNGKLAMFALIVLRRRP